MHPCLQIDEIILSVVQHSDECMPDLVRFALTCRAFYEPAMDLLWADTPRTISKLLQCLPPEVLSTAMAEHAECQGKQCHKRLGAAPPPEWERFLHHAKRVKSLELRVYPLSQEKNLRNIHTLRCHFGGTLIFPKLRALTCWGYFVPHVDLFMHAGVSTCHLVACTDSSIATALFKLEPYISRLAELKLRPRDVQDTAGLTSAQNALLARCDRLSSLSTNIPLSSNMLVHIATLLPLQHLRLHSLSDACLGSSPGCKDLPFPKLRTLQLFVPFYHGITILQTAALPFIEDISVGLDQVPLRGTKQPTNDCDTATLLETLSKFSTLKTLRITLDPLLMTSDVLPGSSLLPLTQSTNLTILTIARLHIDIHASHIRRMATGWPNLQQLVLAPDRLYDLSDWSFQPSICVEDLYPLARHCPYLQRLVIAVTDDLCPSMPLVYDETTTVHCRLQDLSLSGSPLKSSRAQMRVANFVLAVFPCALQNFDALDPEGLFEVHELFSRDTVLADTVEWRSAV